MSFSLKFEMPGTRCTVVTCKNCLIVTRKQNHNVMYHRFPKNESIRNIWIERCGRGGKWDWRSCYVCSVHFKADDYARDLQAELLGITRRKLLNKNAVPSLFLPSEYEDEERSDRLRHECKTYVQEMLSGTHDTVSSKDDRVMITEMNTGNQATYLELRLEPDNMEEIEEKINIVEEPLKREILSDTKVDKVMVTEKNTSNAAAYLELIRLQSNNMKEIKENLELENRNLQKELEHKNDLLNQYKIEMANLMKKQEKEIKKSVEAEVKKILAKCFSESQINMLLNDKKSCHWTDEDISKALTLLYYSKQAYVYLREKLNFPLPSISSLQRWDSGINK